MLKISPPGSCVGLCFCWSIRLVRIVVLDVRWVCSAFLTAFFFSILLTMLWRLRICFQLSCSPVQARTSMFELLPSTAFSSSNRAFNSLRFKPSPSMGLDYPLQQEYSLRFKSSPSMGLDYPLQQEILTLSGSSPPPPWVWTISFNKSTLSGSSPPPPWVWTIPFNKRF